MVAADRAAGLGGKIWVKGRFYQRIREVVAVIYFKVSTDLTEALEPFSYAERGRLFTAMLEYAKDQTTAELCGNERFIWPMVKADIDRQQEAYDRKCETNRANGASRTQSHPVAANDSDSHQINKTNKENKENKTRNIFIPPTREEVRAYCKERHNTVNADKWYDFYEAKGWMVGQNKMKNWQAAVRTWEDSKSYQDGEPKKSKFANVPVN